jgi:hypothetical protein
MVINRIHLGPVVFARTLVASIAARQTAPAGQRPTPNAPEAASRAGRALRSQAIDRRNHVIEGSYQW